MEKKIAVPFELLCKGYPEEFRMYFEYCRALRFDDKPDYSYLKRLFKDLFVRLRYVADGVYDWAKLKSAEGGAEADIPAGGGEDIEPVHLGSGDNPDDDDLGLGGEDEEKEDEDDEPRGITTSGAARGAPPTREKDDGEGYRRSDSGGEAV
jgi:hypothetical protein